MHDDHAIELIRGAEERLVNVWPAPSTMLMDGWVVRFANGYSGRANSASAVQPGARISPAMMALIEQLYSEAGLLSSVRITPLAHPETEAMLLARGYRIKDEASMMLVDAADFRQHRIDPRVELESQPSPHWLEGISIRQEASKRSPQHLQAIVGNLRLPAAFATLSLSGQKLGFGVCATDRGWAELSAIMLDDNHRGQGLGRAIVTSLLAWAAQKDAERAFLQVDVRNSVAVALYESLGFSELCRYRTLVREDSDLIASGGML